jgi:predicted small metal-binding protein
MARYFVDCRAIPSESNCSLYISGDRDEVIRAATEHAVSVHQHDDTTELREMIEGGLQEEEQPVGTAVTA